MQGFNASANQFVTAFSAGAFAFDGSTNASNFAGYEFATMIVVGGSMSSANNIRMVRSGTSNGTFGDFGASLPNQNTACATAIRSFSLDSSAQWYKVFYANGGGSTNMAVLVHLQGARVRPANVIGNVGTTTVFSDVLGG